MNTRELLPVRRRCQTFKIRHGGQNTDWHDRRGDREAVRAGRRYTDNGAVPGINSPVDLNAYDGTADALREDWSGVGVSAPQIEITVTVPAGVKVNVITED